MLALFAHTETSNLISGGDPSINWLAIVLATAAAMVIGSLWYGPLFGKQWMEAVKLKKEDTQDKWMTPMLVMLVTAFIQAYILRHLIVFSMYFYPDVSELSAGLTTAFWVWLGFVVPVVLGSNLFAQRPNVLIKIDLGNYLVTLLVMGAILGAIS